MVAAETREWCPTEIELSESDIEYLDDGFPTGEYEVPDFVTPSYCKVCRRYWAGECACREEER